MFHTGVMECHIVHLMATRMMKKIGNNFYDEKSYRHKESSRSSFVLKRYIIIIMTILLLLWPMMLKVTVVKKAPSLASFPKILAWQSLFPASLSIFMIMIVRRKMMMITTSAENFSLLWVHFGRENWTWTLNLEIFLIPILKLTWNWWQVFFQWVIISDNNFSQKWKT